MSPIYLDHAATTPVRPEVRAAMEPFWDRSFGNPCCTHGFGRPARVALDRSRARIAEALGARPEEIVFVRGGTESDNLAVLGRAEAVRRRGGTPRVACSTIEHPAVLEPMERVGRAAGEHLRVRVRSDGALDAEDLDRALAPGSTSLLSLMWVNNETGIRLPVPEVAERARAVGVPVHTDAVQAVGKVEVRVDRAPVDLLTLTGHKIYGPKGCGALYVRSGTVLEPLLFGGGQERGLRPGTEDVAGAVGLAEAVALAVEEREEEALRLEALRDTLERTLRDRIGELRVHGGEAPRAPHVTNVGIPGVRADDLLAALDLEDVAVSAGSACSSGAHRASHVLRALYGEADDGAVLRFSLGRSTTEGEVRRAAEATAEAVARLRALVEAP